MIDRPFTEIHALSPAGAIKSFFTALVIAGVGYWLFSDTVKFYLGSGKDKPLRVSFAATSEEFEVWKQMLDAFREKYPDIPVKCEFIPARYEQKVQQLMVADDAADVILYQDEPFFQMVESGKFEDLMPYMLQSNHTGDGAKDLSDLKKRYWDTAMESFGRYEGEGDQQQWRQYAVPVWSGCNLIFYNKAAFGLAAIRVQHHDGPEAIRELPDGSWLLDDERWTISDFVRVCQRLTIDTDGDGKPNQYGTTLPPWIYWQTMHWTIGAHLLTPDKKHTLAYGPACEASYQLYHDLRWKYAVVPTPADLGTMTERTGFFTGLASMITDGPWAMPFCNAVAEEGLAYGLIHLPRNDETGYRATRVTWDGLAMYTGSKKKQEAWLLIEYLSSEASQRAIARLQRAVPAKRPPDDVIERAILRGEPTDADNRYAAVLFTTINPAVDSRKFIQATLEYGRLQPITEHWDVMTHAWADALDGLQRIDPAKRYTPTEAIGRFYAEKGDARKLKQLLPPLDPKAANVYRDIYEKSQKP